MIILSLLCCNMISVRADAKSIYLPTKIKTYYYKSETGSQTKPSLSSTITCKRNKYGMVTNMKETFGGKVNKSTITYTYKKGLLTKAIVKNGTEKFKQTFKYNKKNKLTARYTYNLKGKLQGKTKYVYKGSKLVKEKYYKKNKLKRTVTYKWKNNKIVECTFDEGKWTTWDKDIYTYADGKISRQEKIDYERNKVIYTIYDKYGHEIETETILSGDSGLTSTVSYTTYTYDTKGNVTSETYWEVKYGKKTPFSKTEYSSYKKYTVPKGNKIINTEFQAQGCNVYTLVLPEAN